MLDDFRNNKTRPIRFLFENSVFLIVGALAALVWANLDGDSYNRIFHSDVNGLIAGDWGGDEDRDGYGEAGAAAGQSANADRLPQRGDHQGLTLHFLINDVFMALFFAIAAKEVWESFLPGGALSNPRKAATPLLATLGGIVGPAALFLMGAWMLGDWTSLNRGWAIPCATDIAFSYLVARFIFGKGHPAIAFLLLLAIADDAAGLAILAVAYPQKALEPVWLLLTVAAILTGFGFRKLGLQSFWWYLVIPGLMSWFSFSRAGIHPALGLVPVIPAFPHSHTDLGIFVRDELNRHDPLNEFEHWWKNPVELILGLFGLANAGVVFGNVGVGTWLVLIGLLVGKPLGITLFTWISTKALNLELPAGVGCHHIVSLGTVAGIGFTVALFVSSAAFPQPGPIQDSVKMGALLSFAAAALAFVVARTLGVRPSTATDASPGNRTALSTRRPSTSVPCLESRSPQ